MEAGGGGGRKKRRGAAWEEVEGDAVEGEQMKTREM